MRILVTNDDGYFSKGIETLARIMRKFGDVTVVAPKYHQSGMSMAVTMGFKPIAVKQIRFGAEPWYYLDGTPASCVKFGIDNVMTDARPDVVVCGINHGSNAASAALYSGTLGAAQEGAVNGIKAFGVSLDTFRIDADFSAVEALFPDIFTKIMENYPQEPGRFFNINFPNLKTSEIKGVRVASQGYVHWEDEYRLFDPGIYDKYGIIKEQMGISAPPSPEPGEVLYMMAGDLTDNEGNPDDADHHLMEEGYVTVTAMSVDFTDRACNDSLKAAGLETDF